jgi:ATP-dependent DNA ligase
MADQLSLDLRVGPTRLPAMIRPMLAQTAAEPFDSPDHLFEPSWGGMRLLVFVEAEDSPRPPLRLIDERGRDVTALLPELGALPSRVAARPAVLDGEAVVVDRVGRSDPLALAGRMRGGPGPSVAYLAFDLLYRDGRPLLAVPLEKRREQLRRVLRPGEEAIAVPAIAGDGRALYAAVVEAGLAGVTGRSRRSPYLPGVRSRLWKFVARGASLADAMPIAAAEAAAGDAAPLGNAPMLALIRRLPLDDPPD